ncbi:MAG: NADH-quinone oxidoreductase subunit M [Nitrospira sp.]|jgi:NADH-quinone oxidoreductase subunit M|uniref:complex I subunit 4 family protein n=1 Tax=Nitrospira sp. ND1 TaxID=1658518 RepID=UPI0009BAFB2A|nr:NADH-quinone oxidoreductase subunit M [Nitrospira sp. ND1]MBK7418471.1 NADH-quinone oxidoreductase subunit M [Nitrospira sp.]OYT23369.1 MAG: NADH-quinone oxidoreductase subunit M [Nitrospira sp. UW-LDO-02]MBK8376558.1 NADH-quinone oxidoreductase subunit M [Nitrospira sp.]MBK9110473.1 NADH-quinone oxidoreductase subunit M [Nitrospira sp.]MBK9998290.1 NADH-quinone oxidoreductase subunit M [Nitrospira sp.]
MAEYTLLIILFAPFVGALALIFVSNRQLSLVRGIAAGSAFVSLIASVYLFYAYDPLKGGYQFIQRIEWSRQLGISLHLGVDGIGTPLVLASGILLFAGIFVSWHIKDRVKEFYIWILILAAATIGVFMSLDLFFLYFFYEMSVIPMYLLLGMWGSHTKKYLEMTDAEGLKQRDSVGFIFNFGANSKEYAAMKLVLFLSAFAVAALMGILLIYKFSGLNTFDILVLREQAHFSGPLATLIWLLIFFGFASIAPIWPLHSWSPVGHAAAPAATSMLHAGVLMKLGHFSIIRVAFEILPETTRELMPIAAVLCIFSIIYGGLVAYYAKDTKYVIGYSSSSHMGYVFLGMAALDYISLSGAVIYMFAHAMATGMLFAMAGWVYDQTHTRDIPSLGGLSNRMPFISAAFVIGCMASIGMPGTVNFIAEVMIIVGSWNKYPFQVVVAVLGIVLTMAYLFKMMRGLFYGSMAEKYSHSHDAVTVVDRMPLLIMITVSISFGIFPGHLYSVVRSGVDPLIARITKVVPVAEHPMNLPHATSPTIPTSASREALAKVTPR